MASYIGVEVPRRGIHGMEGEAVDGVGDGLSPAVDVNDRDIRRSNGSGKCRRSRRGLARPVKVRSSEVLGRGSKAITQGASSEALGHSLDRGVQSLLIESQIRSVPGDEQNGRVSAVSSESAAGLPVRAGAADAVPGLVGHAMDTGNLVVGRQLALIETLQLLEAQNIEVELVREVSLEVPDLPTQRNRSASAWGGRGSSDRDVAAHDCVVLWLLSDLYTRNDEDNDAPPPPTAWHSESLYIEAAMTVIKDSHSPIFNWTPH